MREFMVRQRVKAINSELVTDLQFARSESVTRSRPVRVRFRADESMTCYTIHTRGFLGDCDCLLPAGAVCPDFPELVEIKTVRVPRSTTVAIAPVDGAGEVVLFSGPRGLSSPDGYQVGIESPVGGKLRTSTNLLGRPQVCTPDGSVSGVASC